MSGLDTQFPQLCLFRQGHSWQIELNIEPGYAGADDQFGNNTGPGEIAFFKIAQKKMISLREEQPSNAKGPGLSDAASPCGVEFVGGVSPLLL
jgi:hypothetical protein